jgi:hypothetical protein
VSRPAYDLSQDLILEAEEALRSGNRAAARVAYSRAAEAQRQLVDELPGERHRTRAIYLLSCASLHFRAQELDEAERAACRALADPGIDPATRARLRDLYDCIQDERRLAEQKLSLSEHRLSIRFLGRSILNGLAPPQS